MLKKRYRVRNWKEYNENLVKRGNITLWFEGSAIKKWYAQEKTKNRDRGRPPVYNDVAIECGLTLKFLFDLSLRATEGLIKSLLKLLKVDLKTPDYTTLCKRQANIDVSLLKQKKRKQEGLNIVVDSTGLKVFGEGEWQIRQHGKTKVRNWRKIHLAINPENHRIENFSVTVHGLQDCQALPLLLDGIGGKINEVVGDGAYDRFSCYEEMEKRNCKGIFPPQRNASLSTEHPKDKRKASEEAFLKRDETIKAVRLYGRDLWKKRMGYHRRSLAETGIGRFKRMVGNQLRSRLLSNQVVEVKIKCNILNKMTMMGMPISYGF